MPVLTTPHAYVSLLPGFLAPELAQESFVRLRDEVTWHETVTRVDTGEPQRLQRKMAYLTNTATDYPYAGLLLPGGEYHPVALAPQNELHRRLGVRFNSVLLNQYRDGRDEIRWHADKEAQLGDDPLIAMVNLGATRTFHMLDRESGQKYAYEMTSGDVLVMLRGCQQRYLHAILKEKHVTEPRISLTYRQTVHS